MNCLIGVSGLGDYWISFDIENKINELLEDGLINSVNQINNYTQWKNQN